MTFTDRLHEHLRRAILEALHASPNYGLHEYILLEQVQALGLGTTRERLREDTQWLETMALISAERVEGALILKLTGTGDDVVRGLSQVPGIARPRP